MQNFLIEHWVELLFSLLSAGIIAYCQHFNKELKNYRTLLAKQDEGHIREIIKEELKPIMDEITIERKKFESLKTDYRAKLIRECTKCLHKGCVTPQEFNVLTELWKVYHEGLGGNGQGEDFYERVCKLPIKEKEE